MRNALTSLFVALFGITSALAYSGGPETPKRSAPVGSDLLIDCQEGRAACYSYLLGIWDGLIIAGKGSFCASGPVSGGKLGTVYINWASSNPTELNGPRGVGVVRAFLEEFACKKL